MVRLGSTVASLIKHEFECLRELQINFLKLKRSGNAVVLLSRRVVVAIPGGDCRCRMGVTTFVGKSGGGQERGGQVQSDGHVSVVSVADCLSTRESLLP